MGFPGGDAMREAFSRLQAYQQNVEMQLDVSYIRMASGHITPVTYYNHGQWASQDVWL